MKLLRLKITDPQGFRSLQAGFEYCFRSEWDLQEEQGFAPFVCAGPNGSGKSNLLEVLAAIFYQLEVLRVRRSFLPEVLQDSCVDIAPRAFELDYLIRVPSEYFRPNGPQWAQVTVWKEYGEPVKCLWGNQSNFDTNINEVFEGGFLDILLPQYVLGYSSGENEILSLPFFKMRFVQFDEYWQALKQQLPYPGRPESRLVYLDNGFSQAILLCNLLFQDVDALRPFREDVGIEGLTEFRIIIRRSIEIDERQVPIFGSQNESKRESTEEIIRNHPALTRIETESDTKRYRLNLVELLEGDGRSDKIIVRLKRCATCWFADEATDTLSLDYYVNDATRQAFRENFDFEVKRSPIALFQAFQVLLTLNLYSVSDPLKADLYQSDSLYVGETVPTLASDERIMRFKNFWVSKKDIDQPVLLKSLSDGEHQLLHTLGLCLLFKNTNSLFLLDEPETHFNPDWRANFITRLHQSFNGADSHDMLVTTHTPFLISDSKPKKVLVFNKTDGVVSVSHPDYNTLGASINKITMATFGKRETIGGHAQAMLDDLRQRFEQGEDKERLISEINRQLGDSVEKVLLIKTILDSMEAQD
ncbi:MAG: restriction system-associated AAA family ATPase [Sedimenticola sp.]